MIITVTGEGFFADDTIAPTLVNWEITFGAICCIFYVVNWLDAFIMQYVLAGLLGVLGGDGVRDLLQLVGGVVVGVAGVVHASA